MVAVLILLPICFSCESGGKAGNVLELRVASMLLFVTLGLERCGWLLVFRSRLYRLSCDLIIAVDIGFSAPVTTKAHYIIFRARHYMQLPKNRI